MRGIEFDAAERGSVVRGPVRSAPWPDTPTLPRTDGPHGAPDRTRKSPFPAASPLGCPWSSGREKSTSGNITSCSSSGILPYFTPAKKEPHPQPRGSRVPPAPPSGMSHPPFPPASRSRLRSPLRCAAATQSWNGRKANGAAPVLSCASSHRRNTGLLATGPHAGWSWWAPGKDGGERRAVHRLKYGGRASLGRALGQAMAAEAPVELWPNPEKWAVVPIPLHRRKQRQRGYNQSALLAEGWCTVTGMAPSPLLFRTRHRSSLTRLGRRDRPTREHLPIRCEPHGTRTIEASS